MRHLFTVMAGLFCTAAFGVIAAPAGAADPLDAFKGLKGTLDIAGGTAHIPVMKGAAQQIMAANKDIRITVTGGGSGVGVQKAGEGLVQIALEVIADTLDEGLRKALLNWERNSRFTKISRVSRISSESKAAWMAGDARCLFGG